MDAATVIQQATVRHRLSRRTALVSWFKAGSDRWTIVATAGSRTGNEAAIITCSCEGVPNPLIASWMVDKQAEIDNALGSTAGQAWVDAWLEGEFLSIICDIWARELLRCRASNAGAALLMRRFDDAFRRVRARISAPSTELPYLAAYIRRFCPAPAARAA